MDVYELMNDVAQIDPEQVGEVLKEAWEVAEFATMASTGMGNQGVARITWEVALKSAIDRFTEKNGI